jgi:hypothetical protein
MKRDNHDSINEMIVYKIVGGDLAMVKDSGNVGSYPCNAAIPSLVSNIRLNSNRALLLSLTIKTVVMHDLNLDVY